MEPCPAQHILLLPEPPELVPHESARYHLRLPDLQCSEPHPGASGVPGILLHRHTDRPGWSSSVRCRWLGVLQVPPKRKAGSCARSY